MVSSARRFFENCAQFVTNQSEKPLKIKGFFDMAEKERIKKWENGRLFV